MDDGLRRGSSERRGEDATKRHRLGIPEGLADDWSQTLEFFYLLYGDDGLRMLRAFFRSGNRVEFGSVWFEGDGFDVDWQSGAGSGGTSNVDVQISGSRSPLEKATILMEALKETRHYWFVGLSDPTIEEFQKFFDAYVSYAADLVRRAAELELAGLTVLNEGADWTLALHEASQGNRLALLAMLPFLSVGMIRVVDRSGAVVALGLSGPPRRIREDLLRFFRRARRGHGTELGLPEFAGHQLGTTATRGRLRNLDGAGDQVVGSVRAMGDEMANAARAAAEAAKQDLVRAGFSAKWIEEFGENILKHAEGAGLTLLRTDDAWRRAVLDINNNYICPHCWDSLRYLIPKGRELIVRLKDDALGALTFSFKWMEHPKLLLDGEWIPVAGYPFSAGAR